MLIKMKSEYLQSFWSLKNSCMGIILVICTGCSTVAINSVDQKTTDEQTETIMVGEVPIPPSSFIDEENTIVLGTGKNWMGRLIIKTPMNSQDSFSFLINEFPKAGWTVLSTIKAKKSTLVFTKDNRFVNVSIESMMLNTKYKSLIELTAIPKSEDLEKPVLPAKMNK